MCKTLQVFYAHRNSTITLFIVKLHQEIMEVITAVLQILMPLSRGLLCIRVKALLIKSLKLFYSCQTNEEEVVTPTDQEKKQR